MPTRTRNSKRGSDVVRLWRARRLKLLDVFALLQRPDSGISVAAAARQYGLPYRFVQKRWKRWVEADRVGDPSRRNAAVEHRGGGHNRSFSSEEEAALANHLSEQYSIVTPTIVRNVAVQFHSILDRQKGQHRSLRSKHPFAASDGFVAGFLRRQQLPLRTARLIQEKRDGFDARDRDKEGFEFVTAVREAVMDFGEDMVWNADEVSSNSSLASHCCSLAQVSERSSTNGKVRG